MNVKFIEFQQHGDERGALVALEEEKNIPFPIRRIYYLFNTVNGVRRGFHAHKKLNQVAIVIHGSCRFYLDDGKDKIELLLDNPGHGLLVEPMIWHEMYDFSEDCVLMVLADDFYDESDYLRNYEQFIKLINGE